MRPIIFFSTPCYIQTNLTQKISPLPVACLVFQPLPFQRSIEGDSSLRFPDSGMTQIKKNDPDQILFPRELENSTTLMMLGINDLLDIFLTEKTE